MKKVVIIITAVLVTLILIISVGAIILFRKEAQVIGTINKLKDGTSLYSMEYAGDYGFDKFLEEGGASSSDMLSVFLTKYISKGFVNLDIKETNNGCSSIVAKTSAGGYLFGRNFDWIECTCMIVKTTPVNGYKSISTVNLDFVGYSKDYQPDSFFNSFLALSAPFVPLDGMNEKGLCVADLVIDGMGETHQDTGKPDLTTTTAIRLILDRAATVDEAVNLLARYDMHSDIETIHHLAIADAFGRSVVVEYIDNIMYVTDTPVVTNFFLTEGESYGLGSESSKRRFNILMDIYEASNGILEVDDIKSALKAVNQSNKFDSRQAENFSSSISAICTRSVVQSNASIEQLFNSAYPIWETQWSVIYNPATGKAEYYHSNDYSNMYEFDIQ